MFRSLAEAVNAEENAPPPTQCVEHVAAVTPTGATAVERRADDERCRTATRRHEHCRQDRLAVHLQRHDAARCAKRLRARPASAAPHRAHDDVPEGSRPVQGCCRRRHDRRDARRSSGCWARSPRKRRSVRSRSVSSTSAKRRAGRRKRRAPRRRSPRCSPPRRCPIPSRCRASATSRKDRS